MKKFSVLAVLGLMVILFSYCGHSKKVAAVPKLTYATTVKLLVETKCAPCHYPDKGGNKKPLNSYVNLKDNIDDIIRRVSLTPADRGFMPFRKEKLDEASIAALKKWKDDGLLEN
jgi:hypothetical protein